MTWRHRLTYLKAGGWGQRFVWRAGGSYGPSCCAKWLGAGGYWSWWPPLWTQLHCWFSVLAERCTKPATLQCCIWPPFCKEESTGMKNCSGIKFKLLFLSWHLDGVKLLREHQRWDTMQIFTFLDNLNNDMFHYERKVMICTCDKWIQGLLCRKYFVMMFLMANKTFSAFSGD